MIKKDLLKTATFSMKWKVTECIYEEPGPASEWTYKKHKPETRHQGAGRGQVEEYK